MKYHLKDDGNPAPCSATVRDCPVGGDHFPNKDAAREAYEKTHGSSFSGEGMILSNGVWVRKGEVGISGFLKEVVEKRGGNNRYSGSLEDLQNLVKENFDNHEPGIGSEDGDVILVNVPSDNFYTDILEITDENRDLIFEHFEARVEGEAPVSKKIIKGAVHGPAKSVKIVVYRADTLAKDDNRSTEDEWEIIAINAQPDDYVPMHPTTMERNSRREKGGTFREYTPEQWEESREYWSKHAYAEF